MVTDATLSPETAAAISGKKSKGADASTSNFIVNVRASTACAAEQDRRFAALLDALIQYRRADEAACVVFTNPIGEPLPPLPPLYG